MAHSYVHASADGGGRMTESTHAKEKLLSTTLKQKTRANGSTCLATFRSNSNKPPPAIPPEPLVIHLANFMGREYCLAGVLNAPPGGATGYPGATAALSPNLRRGPLSPRVRLEKPIRSTCVRMSCRYEWMSGNGNLFLLAKSKTTPELVLIKCSNPGGTTHL